MPYATAQRRGEQRKSGGAEHSSALGGTRHVEQVGGAPPTGVGDAGNGGE
ncbi:hypothetical protein OHB35_15105 [Streptomyces phaeochromogenes]|uniref:Uncharacterized protein n=1 Tax=Streptomyces phaeochromogenes TaxID=1923 RepID=A0ABZ1HA63_STRPH|nr:hypothetical protein [Streptomyces phaeochromogenes]WSD14462.1 hypothetical protein OHB35_15105 [Streptomyces phaeochromogenes]